MSATTRVITAALSSAYAPAHRRLTGIADLRATQGAMLRGLVQRNADTWFGREHGFGRLRSVADYRAAVPITRYDDISPAIDRIADGEPGVLTAEPVRLLEPSSGSTAATKLIPYTSSLLREFQAGLKPWLHDLYAQHPALRGGRSYWSATPAATHPSRDSAVPIGFEDDTNYLGPLAGALMGQVFAVQPDVARAPTMDEFRLRTAVGLLAAEDLTLISIWNPTFLTVLLAWTAEHSDDVLAALPDPRRRAVAVPLAARDWATIWPRLTVLSCWADANAATPAAELAALLPHAVLQPKGLLATEAMISLPLTEAGGAVLAARSHVVEFLADDTCLMADEIEVGGTYEVVVTTGGGLYRYRLGDLVEVTGRHGELPVLRFVGRADKVCDLVGEKLSEAFAGAALAKVGIDGFAMLAPSPDGGRYVLHSEHADQSAVERLDDALRESFHYDYARRLGQLAPVELNRLAQGAGRRHLDAQVARGMRLGDIKPSPLSPTPLNLDPA